jgi:hypothetical protein
MKGKAVREMALVFLGVTLVSLSWVAIIMADGLKPPQDVIITMQSHIEQFGGFFILFDIVVVGLIFRWITMARKPKEPQNVWE